MPLLLPDREQDPFLRVADKLHAAVRKRRLETLREIQRHPARPVALRFVFLQPDGNFRECEGKTLQRWHDERRQSLLILHLTPEIIRRLQVNRTWSSPQVRPAHEHDARPTAGLLRHLIWVWLWGWNYELFLSELTVQELVTLKRALLHAQDPLGHDPELHAQLRDRIAQRLKTPKVTPP